MALEVAPSPEDLPSNTGNEPPNEEIGGSNNEIQTDEDIITVGIYSDEFQNDSDESYSFDANDGYTALGQLSDDDDDENVESLNNNYDEFQTNNADGERSNQNFEQNETLGIDQNHFSEFYDKQDLFNNGESHCCSSSNMFDDIQQPSVSSSKTENHQGTPSEATISMTAAHADTVIQAMAGFKLPSDNIPEWAKHIPEEKWKAKLASKIQKK